ncbi:MAG: anti-sigma factor [Thermoleophilia bacterium]
MRHEDAVLRLPELVGLRPAAADDPDLAAHVGSCERCRARLSSLREIDAGLRALDEVPAPSTRLERRILAIPGSGGQEARPAPRWRWVAAACAILVLGALVGVLATRDDGRTPDGFTAERVVRMATPGSGAMTAHVEVGVAEGGRVPVRIVATGLPHGGGLFYGLWLTGADGAVSGGTFMPDGEGRCVVMLQIPAGPWTGVDITAGDRPPSPRTTVASGDL